MRKLICIALGVALIAGCGVRPDGSNGQRRDFDVQSMSYEQAYHHASSYFQQCTRGIVGFAPDVVNSNIYPDTKTGQITVANSSGIVVARATITSVDKGAHVMIATIKRAGLWNAKDLDAIESAVRTGAIACR
ncbi:MAG TPA: hypothetical protein VFH59_07890 [Frateuria sp.]|uniref:BPTD_2524 family lipoprotein n=1 Tax=Frateuria sp. TaxID=2211372 RepID=UPI002D7FA8F7|nr:hypothetical protein [Frateuria sp.]HET6805343.1 hypothetical protein [Frateuria sp.]